MRVSALPRITLSKLHNSMISGCLLGFLMISGILAFGQQAAPTDRSVGFQRFQRENSGRNWSAYGNHQPDRQHRQQREQDQFDGYRCRRRCGEVHGADDAGCIRKRYHDCSDGYLGQNICSYGNINFFGGWENRCIGRDRRCWKGVSNHRNSVRRHASSGGEICRGQGALCGGGYRNHHCEIVSTTYKKNLTAMD